MEETTTIAIRYWCHMCSQTVNPITDTEIKCPFCQSGFIEEINNNNNQDQETDFGTDHALSIWAPILLTMMTSPRRRRRFRQPNLNNNNNDDGTDVNDDIVFRHHRARRHGGEIDLDREFQSIVRRRQRIISPRIAFEYENNNNNNSRVIMINQTDENNGDYFIGPGLDVLLQHLSENDRQQGIPPANKEAVEGLPMVKVVEPLLQCSVCLDEFEKGMDVKEMPCKHKFHVGCIVSWLEIHNSCPVCRFEIPCSVDGDGEMKVGFERSPRARMSEGGNGNVVENVGNVERGRRFSFTWPFSGLFSSSSASSSSGS